MWKRTISWIVCMCVLPVFGQLAPGNVPVKGKLFDVNVTKSGPYFGLQRGKYTVFELGAERQWKDVKLIKPQTQAIHMGFNYNIKYNVLGYDLGYWIKPSRIGLTYGGNFVLRADFNETRFGFTPVLGYKLFGFHLQTGYHFLTRSASFIETNTFFVNLRFVLIKSWDVDIDRKKGGLFSR